MNCKNCGAVLTGTETVCPNCGAPIENVAISSVAPVVTEPVMEPTPVAAPPVVEPTPVAEVPVMEPAPVATAPVVEPTPVAEVPVMEPTPIAQPPVVEAPPVAEPTPVVEQPAPAIAQPTPPTGFVEPAVAAMQPSQPEEAEKPKKDNKTIILIIALIAVAIIAVVVYFLVLAPASEPQAPASGNKSGSGDEVSTKTETTETYAGYTFTIPDGFTAKKDSEYGLMIGDSTMVFTISVDYSHKYDEYKKSLTAKYPDQADKLVATVEGREYLALILTNTDNSQGTQYVTKASDNATFVGMVIRSDYTAPTTIEFSKLTEILDNAKLGSSSFTPGDNDDVGKNGEKIYTFTKDKFKFGE